MAIDINGDGLIAVGGTSTTQGRVRLAEDTDNGTNYVELTAPALLASNVTVTMPNADGTLINTDPGTSGNVLTSNGTAWVSQAAAAGGGDYIMQVFTTPGTWTKPAGLKAIKVTVIGGGGGGGGAGGTTSFGSPAFLSATGGAQGLGSAAAGGSGSGGQLNASGGPGMYISTTPGCGVGFVLNGNYRGGESAFGFGAGRSTAGAGLAYGGGNGTQLCGGGGGSIEYLDAPALPGPQPYTVGAGGSSSPVPAGNGGGVGVVIVEEFY